MVAANTANEQFPSDNYDYDGPTWQETIPFDPSETEYDSSSKLSRRALLAGMGGVTLVAIAIWGANKGTDRIGEHDMDGSPRLFEDGKAGEIAAEHDINVTSLVEPGYELSSKFNAFKDEDLLPIFPPMVYEHKDLLRELASKHDIPVNFIAFTVAVESGGNPNVVSEKGAVGLYQLMPQLHLQGVIDENEWLNPQATGDIAMKYLANCLSGAREYLDPKMERYEYRHPDLFIRAAGMYNAGVNGAWGKYEDLPFETQQYMNHCYRFIQVAEVAAGLRNEGYGDRQIIEALRSPAVDARAYALGENSYDAQVALEYLKQDPLSPPGTSDPEFAMKKDLFSDYAEYISNPIYTVPLNAFTRIQTSTAGMFILGEGYEKNGNPDNYYNLNTR